MGYTSKIITYFRGKPLSPKSIKQLIPILEEIQSMIEPYTELFIAMKNNVSKYKLLSTNQISMPLECIDHIRLEQNIDKILKNKFNSKYYAFSLGYYLRQYLMSNRFIEILSQTKVVLSKIQQQKPTYTGSVSKLLQLIVHPEKTGPAKFFAIQLNFEKGLKNTTEYLYLDNAEPKKDEFINKIQMLYANEVAFAREVRKPIGQMLDNAQKKLTKIIKETEEET